MAMETTLWHPADIFSDEPKEHTGFSIVVLNQPMELPPALYKKIWENSSYQVAADGGANRVHDIINNARLDDEISSSFLNIDSIIGDLDSLRQEVREYWYNIGSEIIHDPDQDSTDFTKAVNYLRTFDVPSTAVLIPSQHEEGASRLQKAKSRQKSKDIVSIGGLGGRVDQAMSTLHHLYLFQKDRNYMSGKMFLLSSEAISFVLRSGRHKIKVRENCTNVSLGKHIGIIPLKEPSTITTEGLEWDVTDWRTEFGGQISTSNHVKRDWVTIDTTKDVLFTIDLNVAPENQGVGIEG